ncbi:MAG TPA: hypothetical protein DCS93_00690 [Microscillaceae bacterium]|nr:hypothetical protein [Microscillaceae bacterium]
MQQDQNPIFWLTQHIIENDILSKSHWTQGWASLHQHQKSCQKTPCADCLVYAKVLQIENEFHEFMLQQAVFTSIDLNNKQFDVQDYYQYWADEYRKPALNEKRGEARTPAVHTIGKQASTASDLKGLLKKFARVRAINLVKKSARRKNREVFMKASLEHALAQKAAHQSNVEEQYANQETQTLLPLFIQRSTQVDPQATFAFIVKHSPELLLDHPHLVDQSVQTGNADQVRQQVLSFIQDYQTQETEKPPFLPTISTMMGLKKNDIHNWYRKPGYKRFLHSWKNYLSGK